ncbi:hypothetical protein TRFO_02969 [Tritrichomonas foetus]|uniref:DUF3447 domain-containing protein n=1 Tax=Tritrichomonas foetus TaxID=1144522 RepID=A0A1J4KV08_9EUKA|nr:hypothetical protein TRFO_02969 [Tritrichomonas foetus]|eukprot:OHT14720.1 hypothetical protein TRFO_02969 [Tritrichomonas foetus]
MTFYLPLEIDRVIIFDVLFIYEEFPIKGDKTLAQRISPMLDKFYKSSTDVLTVSNNDIISSKETALILEQIFMNNMIKITFQSIEVLESIASYFEIEKLKIKILEFREKQSKFYHFFINNTEIENLMSFLSTIKELNEDNNEVILKKCEEFNISDSTYINALINISINSPKNIDKCIIDHAKRVNLKRYGFLEKFINRASTIFINNRQTMFLIHQLFEEKLLHFLDFDDDFLFPPLFIDFIPPSKINNISGYDYFDKNDLQKHKELIKKGENPDNLIQAIKNDNVELLQQYIASRKLDINTFIKASIYDRSIVSGYSINSLRGYAAFYGAIKCFKFLLVNQISDDFLSPMLAVHGGNLEIIHICVQRGVPMGNSLKEAIKTHNNDIICWSYENGYYNREDLSSSFWNSCFTYFNFGCLSYFLNNYIEYEEFLYYAVKYNNIELVHILLKSNFFDINQFWFLFFLIEIFDDI